MHEVVTLSITSFRGSIGGEHYYGKFHVETKADQVIDPDGSVRHVRRAGYGVERHPHDGLELRRRLGAKEAVYLNKKDSEGFFPPSTRLKAGDMTTRYNDVDSLVASAMETFRDLFDDTDVLLFERRRDSDEYEILIAPEDVRRGLEGRLRFWDQEEWLMANGYLLKEQDRAPDEPTRTDQP